MKKICVFVLLLFLGLSFAACSASKQFGNALDNGDLEKAVQIYAKNDGENNKEIQERIIAEYDRLLSEKDYENLGSIYLFFHANDTYTQKLLDQGISDYGAGTAEKNYVEALYYLIDVNGNADAKAYIKQLENIGTSKTAYNKAKELKGAGKYADALTSLDDVIADDTENYPNVEKCRTEIKDERYNRAVELLNKKQYQNAVDYFSEGGDYKDTSAILDKAAEQLINDEDYATAQLLLFQHNDNEAYMQEFYYKYLNWQMENYQYEAVAETYAKVLNYADVSTNDKFTGAKVLYLQPLTLMNTELSSWTTGVYFNQEFSFSGNTLNYHVHGGKIYFLSATMDETVDIDKSWEFRFDGKDVYYKDEHGEYVKGGTIGKYSSPSAESKDATLTISLDLPGAMKITNTAFDCAREL